MSEVRSAGQDTSAIIRRLMLAGQQEEARALAARLIGDDFGFEVASVNFTTDEYSLNSVSGRITLAGGVERFFKFHTEDGEAGHVTEYYRGELLAAAGLPVERPVAVSTVPGRQVALYELRTEPRLADICFELERSEGKRAQLPAPLLAARRELDFRSGQVAVASMRPSTSASAGASIHQLFYHRLAGPGGVFPGGRYLSWYVGQPGWDSFATRRWRINGVEYTTTLDQIVAAAAELLKPEALAQLPVVTAHGDDHQGNIWLLGSNDVSPAAGHQAVRLRLFDPAFAGTDLPALLAPVKATYHNGFAHPFWLYHPEEAAARFRYGTQVTDERVEIEDETWTSLLREEILASVAELVWRPLLTALRNRGELPGNWRPIVRAALACCPLLVTNLIASTRPEPVQLLALARVVQAGSEPTDGSSDQVSRFLDQITP